MLSSIFFDAGNTLVFPEHSKTLAPLTAAGFPATQEQLDDAERFAKKHLDEIMEQRTPGQSVDGDYWKVYYTRLFEELGAPEEVIAPCVAATRRSGHWSRVRAGTRDVLQTLRDRGLRLGVISNSDGHIEDIIRAVGIGDYFESFTDSGNVRVEKPDPEIFRIALASLDARAGESLFIGDTYSVDIVGARAAGMQTLLMDPAGVYRHDPHPRIDTLDALLTLELSDMRR